MGKINKTNFQKFWVEKEEFVKLLANTTCILAVLVLFIYGSFYTYSYHLSHADIHTYKYYVELLFEKGEYNYGVLYFPHFYYFYYLLHLLNTKTAFLSICCLNLMSIAVTFKFLAKIKPAFGWICKLYMIFQAFDMGASGNLGPLFFGIYVYIWHSICKKGPKNWHWLVLGFFLMKPTFVLMYAIIVYSVEKEEREFFFLKTMVFVLAINFPIIFANIDTFFCKCFYRAYYKEALSQSSGDFDDISFVIPFLYLSYLVLRKMVLKKVYKAFLAFLVVLVFFSIIL